jgi:M6 family metalloprotease-like protein
MNLSRVVTAILLIGACVTHHTFAAPFARTVEFTQPDGEIIRLWGEGNEFYAVFETLDGYTVLFDETRKAYCYAVLNNDGTALLSSGVPVGDQRPPGLQPHIRIEPEIARELAIDRRSQWEEQTGIIERWNLFKRERRLLENSLSDGPVLMAPPASHTVGEISGIVLLIDFDDDVSSVTKTEVEQFCNLPGYSVYGNNGSVRDYFYEVSNGMLLYTNTVLQYVRIPNSLHPKSYYTDSEKNSGESANELILDALNILKAQSNFDSEIAPLIDSASLNNMGQALALNVFYAGGNGGVWSRGLWPHMWGLYEVGAYQLTQRTSVFTYQITNIGSELAIGTFCHENGHMICGYPDLYDYGYDSTGGAGKFCIMGSGGHGKNPVQVCAYLKYASGWTTTVDIQPYEAASLAARTTNADYNKVYRYENPKADTEYYLFEPRSRIDRDATLPAQGVLIWHIDELGDRDNQSTEFNDEHLNYECSLEQADGLYDFENYVNDGDANDAWFAGNSSDYYANQFSDKTRPSAKWWNGSDSNLRVVNISPAGDVMTFDFIPPAPVMLSASGELPFGREWAYYSYSIGVFGGVGEMTWSIIDGALPQGIELGLNSGVLAGYPTQATNANFTVELRTTYNIATTNTFSITVLPVHTVPYQEDFEQLNGLTMPDSWTQNYLTNSQPWQIYQSLHEVYPRSAYSPTNFVALFKASTNAHVTALITPRIDFGAQARAGRLSFQHYMQEWAEQTDILRVYFKTGADENWQLLDSYTAPLSGWTERIIDLPQISRAMYFAFEGTAQCGRGVCIDSVRVWDPTPPYSFVTDTVLSNAILDQPYLCNIQVQGGVEPYTLGVVSNALPLGLTLAPTGTISGVASEIGRSDFTVRAVDEQGAIIEKKFTLFVTEPVVPLFEEDFENYGQMPYGWTQEFVEGTTPWIANNIGYQSHPPAAQQGEWHAYFRKNTEEDDNGVRQSRRTRLVSPQINLGQSPGNVILYFWHHMQNFDGDQDELKVLYRNTIDGEWSELANYTADTPQWTLRSLQLPDPNSTYYIAFEGRARFGYGICIDNLWITDESTAPIITTPEKLPFGWAGQEYETTLQANGGLQPYQWSLVAGTLPDGMTLSTNGVLSGVPATPYFDAISVSVHGADSYASTNQFILDIKAVPQASFFEDFEHDGALPEGWSQVYISGYPVNWGCAAGTISDKTSRSPVTAYEGDYNVSIFNENTQPSVTRLITPMLDLGGGVSNVVLTFQHHMEVWGGDQDQLKVYYRNSTNGSWNLIASYNQNTSPWTERSIALPEPSSTYYVAFEGWPQNGYGICIDNVAVSGEYVSPYNDWLSEYFTQQELDDGLITGLLDDPDGDGIQNIWEYAFYLDPQVFDAEGTPTGEISDNYLQLTYRQNKSADDLDYVVEATSNLVYGIWTTADVSEVVRIDMSNWWKVTVQHDVPVTNAPSRFMRLKLLIK